MNSEDQRLADITKALRPEVTREQLYAVVEALHEAIETLLEMPEDDMESESVENESDSEDGSEQSEPIDTPEGPQAVGDPDKNEVNWPVAKSADDNINKSIWGGVFK